MSTHLLLCHLEPRDVLLPAGVATTVDLPIDGARDWRVLVRNVGANPLTAMTVARGALGVDNLEDATAVSTGLPLAANAALPIVGTAEPILALRVVLTSASGTTVRLSGGGR